MRKWFNSRAMHPAKMAAVALSSLMAVTSVVPAFAGAGTADAVTTTQNDKAKKQKIIHSHALTIFGDTKYGADFKNFEYANPAAPKGGEISTTMQGSFDSLNPYIFTGESGAGLGMVFDTLMEQSTDEPSSSYGLLAESVDYPEDRSWVQFNLRKEARWHDGFPVTADDVVWTFNTLRDKGHPFYRFTYGDVDKAEKVDDYTVKFTFKNAGNRQLMFQMGGMAVLPKHYWEKVIAGGKSFDRSGSVMPLGSGPYKVSSYQFGNHINYERVKDWWAKDLPVNKGRYNFDGYKYEYFRDQNTAMSLIGRGDVNFHSENTAKKWATEYQSMGSIVDGRMIKEEIADDTPVGMQAFVMNTRRTQLSDPRVREAISLMFNFEWSNRMLAYSAYTRTDSYFENSDLESSGLPQGRELEILKKFRGRIPDEIFTKEFTLPDYGIGSGYLKEREMGIKAIDLLKEAGYGFKDGKMVNLKTKRPLSIEFLLVGSGFERWVAPYKKNLERIGIESKIRTVDSAQYQRRVQQFDYDVIVGVFRQQVTPGAEIRNLWSSDTADQNGTQNYAGIKDPVVDELTEMMINADTRDELRAAARALDRVLLSGHYVVPHYHIKHHRIVRGKDLKRPETFVRPALSLRLETWWDSKAEKPKTPKP